MRALKERINVRQTYSSLHIDTYSKQHLFKMCPRYEQALFHNAPCCGGMFNPLMTAYNNTSGKRRALCKV